MTISVLTYQLLEFMRLLRNLDIECSTKYVKKFSRSRSIQPEDYEGDPRSGVFIAVKVL